VSSIIWSFNQFVSAYQKYFFSIAIVFFDVDSICILTAFYMICNLSVNNTHDLVLIDILNTCCVKLSAN